MLKRPLIVLVLLLVLLAIARVLLWESASKPPATSHAFGDMTVDQAARNKKY